MRQRVIPIGEVLIKEENGLVNFANYVDELITELYCGIEDLEQVVWANHDKLNSLSERLIIDLHYGIEELEQVVWANQDKLNSLSKRLEEIEKKQNRGLWQRLKNRFKIF